MPTDAKIQELKRRLINLETENTRLKERVAELEARVATLEAA